LVDGRPRQPLLALKGNESELEDDVAVVDTVMSCVPRRITVLRKGRAGEQLMERGKERLLSHELVLSEKLFARERIPWTSKDSALDRGEDGSPTSQRRIASR
jgi:hypothetical protein